MRAYIKGICVLNENGIPRTVALSPGLNIISGDSQTGKSALLEIIDYCLGSSSFTIPEGKIADFAAYYGIILCVENRFLLLGRKGKAQSSRMLLKQVSSELDIKDINLSYFEDTLFKPLDQVLQNLASQYLGFTVLDTTEEYGTDMKGGKSSIRNMVSFLFQHQNLIASKFALFYRFDDPYKKRGTINQFPVFAGWVDQKYYTTLVRADKLKQEISKLEKNIALNAKLAKEMEGDLRTAFKHFYNLLGRYYNPDWTLQDLGAQIKQFSSFKTPLQVQEPTFSNYDILLKEHQQLSKEDIQLRLRISKLKRNEENGGEYSKVIASLNTVNLIESEHQNCPICGTENKELSTEANKVREAQKWLQTELSILPKHTKTFALEIAALQERRDEIKEILKIKGLEIEKIEELSKDILKGAQLESQKLDAQKSVEVEFRYMQGKIKNYDSGELTELKENLNTALETLKAYDTKNKYREAQVLIQNRMNRIVGKLDFEFSPPNLRFDLESESREAFYLYHNDEDRSRRIFLGQMGSGSNWLACHLGLFLSFLHYFSITPTSKTPTFLFLDQPSQVFFPKGVNTPNDKGFERVAKIYKAILDELELIQKEAGFQPQVIVTDHIITLKGYLDLDKSYFKTDWNHGTGFI